jgi:hypothetical protein
MYTLEVLQTKTFNELKEIGQQLNVLPEGDRRRRQNWIEAIAGINTPLLQLLEVSPEPKVEQVQPVIETVKTSASVEVEPAQEAPLESKFGRIVYPRPTQAIATPEFQIGDLVKSKTMLWGLEKKSMLGEILERRPRGGLRVQFRERIEDRTVYGGTFDFAKSQLEDLIRAQDDLEPIDDLINTSQRQDDLEPIDALINTSQRQDAIEPAAKTSPGVEVDSFPDCPNCFDDGYIEDEFGRVTVCRCNKKPKFKSAIAPAAKNHLEEKSEATKNHLEERANQNLILTGITFSAGFLARYSPPQPVIIHYEIADGYKADTDGQLNLFEVQVMTEPEPPDPDDFESLDAFREAIARWDWEHPSSFDHFCDLQSSVHSDPLEVSLDSFCEWAPCPDDWYEPAALKQSKVPELSQAPRTSTTSTTSDFFIPTFGRWCDRSDRGDEPPDTGVFARLPKPKPPTFPPQVSQSNPKLSRSYPETIPKPFHRVAAGSSTQPARSPPGGDAL